MRLKLDENLGKKAADVLGSHPSLPNLNPAIGILECISIRPPQGTALIDYVITYLAHHLAK